MHLTLRALNNCIDRHNTQDFPSLLLTLRYLCQCCHTRARSGGVGSACLLVCHRRTVEWHHRLAAGPRFARTLPALPLRLHWEPAHEWRVGIGNSPTHTHLLILHALQSQPIFIPLSLSLAHNVISQTLSVLSLVSGLYNTLSLSLSCFSRVEVFSLTPTDSETCAVQRRTHEV